MQSSPPPPFDGQEIRSPSPHFDSEDMRKLRRIIDEWESLQEMREAYKRAGWLGWFLWRLIIVLGSFAAGAAAFKNSIVSLFRGG